MVEKLVSIAIVIAMAVPVGASAESVLYGRINNSLVHTDSSEKATDAEGGVIWRSEAEGLDVEDNTSRLGVKGSEDLGNGLKGIFQIELQMETADGGSTSRPPDGFGTRLGYVGLKGGFGTLAIGRQWTPYYGSVDKSDVFQLDRANEVYLGPTRTGDAITYHSPSLSGLSARAALIVSSGENDTGENFADAYNLSLDYASGPLSIGASYLSKEGDVDEDQWGIGARYKLDRFALIAQYEDGHGEADAWALAGQLFFGNNTLTLKYGEEDDTVSFEDGEQQFPGELEEWVVEYQHHLSKRTRMFVTYDVTEQEADAPADEGAAKGETDRLGIGVRHDF